MNRQASLDGCDDAPRAVELPIDCAHEIVPVGLGHWGVCTKCGDDTFPISDSAAAACIPSVFRVYTAWADVDPGPSLAQPPLSWKA